MQVTPEQRVRKLIARQIAASEIADDTAREQALHETFVEGTVMSTIGGGRPANEIEGNTFAHGSIAALEVGGTTEAVWFDADLAFEYQAKTWALRYTGVAAKRSDWKIVAGSIVVDPMPIRGSGKPDGDPFPNSNPPDELARLALDGAALSKALAPDAIIIGPEHERGHGPGELGEWASRKLELDTNPREIVDPSWATLQANAVFPKGNLGVFVVAVPESSGGWTPVFVQYIGK
jgi:hypothetical protein